MSSLKKISIILLLASLSINTQAKQLIGKALLEYSIFKIDVYEISYFKDKEGYEEIVLDYKIKVKRKHSQEGWKTSLEEPMKKAGLSQRQISWIYQNSVDMNKNDTLSLIRQKDKVTILKNKKLIATITDKVIAKLILDPWIGEFPIDKIIKYKLLGVKDNKSEKI